MPTIKIQTSQNIELEYELAGIGDRLVAYIIDLLIYAAYIITVFLIADVAGGKSGTNWTPLFLILPIFFYQLLCEVFLNGQSLGKKAKQIKVISL
ncbi:MAG: RDD family protein, partial [Chitinophagaceae bacterium]